MPRYDFKNRCYRLSRFDRTLRYKCVNHEQGCTNLVDKPFNCCLSCVLGENRKTGVNAEGCSMSERPDYAPRLPANDAELRRDYPHLAARVGTSSMSERLTAEREAEIRAWDMDDSVVRDLINELDAVRADEARQLLALREQDHLPNTSDL